MNAAYVHLVLNHVPIFGILLGTLLLVTALVERNDVLKRAALVTLLASAVAAGPVYLSGEPAEEVVEDLSGVSEAAIEGHEGSALVSLVAAGALAMVALAGWWTLRRGRAVARHFVTASLVLAVVAGVLLARTAHLGGQIRHTEIRGAAAVPAGSDDDHEPAESRAHP
ncbi:MAG TPA: hypothetical protein VNI61_00595 [Gemmatimonadales bacterium]|nr:hypothetical protein [Gemmatimonadales bacterium]